MKKLNNKGFTAVEGLLIIIVIGVLGVAGYYVYKANNKTDTSIAPATSQTETPKTSVETQAETEEITENLIPGQVDMGRGDGSIMFNPIFKHSYGVREIWVDYGLSPDKLTNETAHYSKNLDEGEGTYAFGLSVGVKESLLTPGEYYFYRVSAKRGGKIVHSAVASFTNTK